uniref:Uncharacterized protein n=1 Tax=Arundo donax TaxID=35708 RepID=A0A0A9GXJ3_ARUDO
MRHREPVLTLDQKNCQRCFLAGYLLHNQRMFHSVEPKHLITLSPAVVLQMYLFLPCSYLLLLELQKFEVEEWTYPRQEQ